MKVIDYFLNNFVFPEETKIFNNRLLASPWDLLSSKNKCGFSGTNDTSLLIPLTIHQREPQSYFLRATNGKILKLVLQKSEFKQINNIRAIELTEFIIEEKIDALIDVGAYLAGFDNEKFANILLEKIDTRFEGVVYFDLKQLEWKFKNRDGVIWSLVNSPVKERNAFVFFDQRRCRGSDMKLSKNAKGLITISTNLKKDDFIQACGRMRGLEYGQTLLLTGDKNISRLIRESVNSISDKIEVKHVIEYVLINVVKNLKNGFLIFAENGKHYYIKKHSMDNCIQKELSSLEELYLGAILEESIYKQLKIRRNDETIHEIDKIYEHVKNYGNDELIEKSNNDEESEREREKEIEVQIEKLIEYFKFTARKEQTFQENKFSDIFKFTKDFSYLNWSKDINISENFLKPIENMSFDYKFDDYLQIVNYILINLQKVILITDREAELFIDRKLDIYYSNYILVHFSKLKLNWFTYSKNIQTAITQLKLFAGETLFDFQIEKEIVLEMIINLKSIENLKNIIIHRGNFSSYEKSNLEKISKYYCENVIGFFNK